MCPFIIGLFLFAVDMCIGLRWLGEDLESRSNPMGLAGPTPISKHLAETGSLPKGRALVPGCGTYVLGQGHIFLKYLMLCACQQ